MSDCLMAKFTPGSFGPYKWEVGGAAGAISVPYKDANMIARQVPAEFFFIDETTFANAKNAAPKAEKKVEVEPEVVEVQPEVEAEAPKKATPKKPAASKE